MEDWKTVKAELLKDPKVLREYKKLEPRYKIISKLIEARLKRGVTQAVLAKKVGTKQPSISRLEAGEINPTIEFLHKIATALNMNLNVQFN